MAAQIKLQRVDRVKNLIPRFTLWFTIRRVGILLFLLALPGVLISYHDGHPGRLNLLQLFSGSYISFSWEMVSIAFTILIIDQLYQIQDVRQEKAQLVQQLRSKDESLVVEAVERLRTHGWLTDGTLRGCNLERGLLRLLDLLRADLTEANLKQADLNRSNLERACLEKVNLQRASLYGANMQLTRLEGASFEGADLSHTNLRGAQGLGAAELARVDKLAYAIMPDGRRYNGRHNLPGDLLAARLAGFSPDDDVAMARFYDVSLSAYRRGR